MSDKEKLNNTQVLKLNIEAFDALSESQKILAYHLSNAGLAGRMIYIHQKSPENVVVFDTMIDFYKKIQSLKDNDKELENIVSKVRDSLFIMFVNNGVYESSSGQNIIPSLPLKKSDLECIKSILPEDYKKVSSLIFENKGIKEYRTVQKSGVDVVKESGVNYYHNLTTDEVNNYREEKYKEEDQNIAYGFNEMLIKNPKTGEIESQYIYADGLYGKYVKQVILHLNKAVLFAENENQKKSIESLVKFYKTGDAKDFNEHSIAWVQDQDSSIYFVNGLIECYEDPLGLICSYESLVAFKDPEQTAKVKKIIESIQYFEDNLPVSEKYKKEKAIGLSASSINVISMAGATSPVLPLGINLPNSETIRKEYGSKSVTLANVDSARTSDDVKLSEVLYLEKNQGIVDYANKHAGTLHTDLHEIAGHGSCKTMPGVTNDSLSMYYSVIEETRADLVGLYYIADPKMKKIGIYNEEVDLSLVAKGKYIGYITNGAIGQLRRVELGKDLTQAHFRNRQLISTYLLEKCSKEDLCLVEKDGSYYIDVNNVEVVKEKIGELLREIQRIKSEGDLQAAKEIVEKYGTKVNQAVHKEIIERFSCLDFATTTAFRTPILKVKNKKIVVDYYNDFIEEQLALYEKYR